MTSKVSCAVAAILSGTSLGAFAAASAPQTAILTASAPVSGDSVRGAAGTEALAEVVVTAQRRKENVQNVPIAVQAFTSQTLAQLNVKTFDDYMKYLPSVSSANNGPGQNEIFMRGLSAGAQPSQGSASTAPWPNVAIYLDNQSGQLPGRNLDVYAADLARIEVLEGPQGTLFGAGAEAGVIRYITNEPKLAGTEAEFSAEYSVTAHGDPNESLTGVFNLPLIPGKLGLRTVLYDDSRGGYIDNVPGTFTRKNTDVGIHYANYPAVNGQCPDGQPNNGYCVPPGSPSIDNYDITRRAINPATYKGVRAEALYRINDDWDVLLSQMYQNLDTEGVFFQQPSASDGKPLAPLEVTLFNPSWDKDRFESTALTVEGRVGPLKALYSGGYLTRHVDQNIDYTNYARGVYADYYQCYGPGTGGDNSLASTCFSPSATVRSVEQNKHLQNEIRLSTPDDWRLRAIGGIFLEDNKLYDQSDWRYKTVPACTSNAPPGGPGNSGCISLIGTAPGTTVVNPGVRDPHSSFYQDDVRDTRQRAFYLSVDYDLIPKTKILTATVGTRHFRFDNSFKGAVNGSFGCFEHGVPPGGCQGFPTAINLDGEHLADTESGFKSRANVTWRITPDVMVYYTWSQGFRPGGFNQNGGAQHAFGPDGQAQYILPAPYHPDSLTNNEIGWKTEWFDHHVQWNSALYREKWNDVQVAFFDPGLVGNVFYDTNGQNFLLRGVETNVAARVSHGLTLQGAASWNHSEQTNSPALVDNNPASVNYGKPITVSCGGAAYVPGSCAPITNPFGPIGSPTANSPPVQYSLRVRYDLVWGDSAIYVQAGAVHVGHSFTQAGANPTIAQAGAITTGRLRFEAPAYTTYDASIGIAKDAWTVTFFGENLNNSNAAVFISTDNFIVAQTPLRPRVMGGRISYSFR